MGLAPTCVTSARLLAFLCLLHNRIAQHAKVTNLDLANVSRPHPQFRVTCHPDAGRRASYDEIASFEREDLAEEHNESLHIEDHVGDRCILHNLSVESGLQVQPLAARRKNRGRYEERTEGPGAVEVLTHRPLRCPELEVSKRGIVEDGVACDVA